MANTNSPFRGNGRGNAETVLPRMLRAHDVCSFLFAAFLLNLQHPLFFFFCSFFVCSSSHFVCSVYFLFAAVPVFLFAAHQSFLFAAHLFCLQRSFFVCSSSFLFAAFIFCLQRSLFVCSASFLFAAFVFCLQRSLFVCSASFLFAALLFICSMSLVGHRTIQLFWLFPLNGFDFIFLLRDSENDLHGLIRQSSTVNEKDWGKYATCQMRLFGQVC